MALRLVLRAQNGSADGMFRKALEKMSIENELFGIHGKALADATKQQGTVSGALEKAMGYRVPVQPSADGNTVEMSTEQTLFAENAVKYRTTLSFLEGRLNTITRALKGE